jgi:hypothetical protein
MAKPFQPPIQAPKNQEGPHTPVTGKGPVAKSPNSLPNSNYVPKTGK